MKKEKRLSKADGLKVLKEAYNLIKNGSYTYMCRAIEMTAVELSLADISCVALHLIPELKMFKPVNKRNSDFWFHESKKRCKVIYNKYVNRYI